MEERGSSSGGGFPPMGGLIMNECNSGKCAPWTAEETPKPSRAPEGIGLWQTTSPMQRESASASNKTGEGAILSADIMKLRFWFPVFTGK